MITPEEYNVRQAILRARYALHNSLEHGSPEKWETHARQSIKYMDEALALFPAGHPKPAPMKEYR